MQRSQAISPIPPKRIIFGPTMNYAPIPPPPVLKAPPVPPRFGRFQDLPADIRVKYLPNLMSADTLLSLCQTRKEYQSLCADPKTWERYLLQDFNFDWSSRAAELNQYLLPPQPGSPSNQRIFYEYLRLTDDLDVDRIISLLQKVSKIIGQKIDFLKFYQRSLLAGYMLDDQGYNNPDARKQNIYDFLIHNVEDEEALTDVAEGLATLYRGPDFTALRQLAPLYLVDLELNSVRYRFLVGNFFIDLSYEDTTFENYNNVSAINISSRAPRSVWGIDLITENPDVARKLPEIASRVATRLKQPLPLIKSGRNGSENLINEIAKVLIQELGLTKIPGGPSDATWKTNDGLTTLELSY